MAGKIVHSLQFLYVVPEQEEVIPASVARSNWQLYYSCGFQKIPN